MIFMGGLPSYKTMLLVGDQPELSRPANVQMYPGCQGSADRLCRVHMWAMQIIGGRDMEQAKCRVRSDLMNGPWGSMAFPLFQALTSTNMHIPPEGKVGGI